MGLCITNIFLKIVEVMTATYLFLKQLDVSGISSQ